MILHFKPLSVNEAWQGKRYKTPKYKRYEVAMLYSLPHDKIPEGKLRIDIKYGFSNVNSDIDNPTKMFLDILQKRYNFNDSRVYELNLKKEIVKKGDEFIKYDIKHI